MNTFRSTLTRVWNGVPLSGDDIIALLLIAGILISACHIVTLVVTRWGDRHIAFKAMVGSLLVHAVCWLGLEVFEPLAFSPASAETLRQDPPETESRILVHSDETRVYAESGNTPVPDLPTAQTPELQRLAAESRQLEDLPLPDRIENRPDGPQTSAEDIAQFSDPDHPTVVAPADAGTEAAAVAAARDPAAEFNTEMEQSTADLFSPATERESPLSGDFTEQPESAVRMDTGGRPDRLDVRVNAEDIAVRTQTSPAETGLQIPNPDGADETIRMRSAPIAAADAPEPTGVEAVREPVRSLPSRTMSARLPRPERFRPSADDAARPSRSTSDDARTPLPLSDDYDEVRLSRPEPVLSDALRSAASLVDIDRQEIRRRDSLPATYQLRTPDLRKKAAARFGGTTESESAVELSLRWLASVQSRDGNWVAAEFGAGLVSVDENGVQRDFAGRDSDSGVTALSVLAFLGAGYTGTSGRYAVEVDRALDWLISNQGSDGNLCGKARHYSRMYCHAMATYALAEACAMQQSGDPAPLVEPELLTAGPDAVTGIGLISAPTIAGFPTAVLSRSGNRVASEVHAWRMRRVSDVRLRAALLKAVTFTISQQDPDSGGWRYKFGQEGDVSMLGWQLMSLKSAEIAGVRIDARVRSRMERFLQSVSSGRANGLAAYRRGEAVTEVMTAEALFCRQMLGEPADSSATSEAVGFLMRNLPEISRLNFYYWYYGTLAMHQHGGRPWEEWNRRVRDALVVLQRTDGEHAGSWDPNGPWGRYGGRIYSTAVATLTLEAYYRLLPLYRMDELTSAAPAGR